MDHWKFYSILERANIYTTQAMFDQVLALGTFNNWQMSCAEEISM